ncbi:MAG: putative molybdenum carrier protein, partial [Ignavibacteria bacterium]
NGKITSRGSLLTLKTARENDKPCVVNPTGAELIKWIKSNNISVLNVAGNRESTSAGIYERVKRVLLEMLRER